MKPIEIIVLFAMELLILTTIFSAIARGSNYRKEIKEQSKRIKHKLSERLLYLVVVIIVIALCACCTFPLIKWAWILFEYAPSHIPHLARLLVIIGTKLVSIFLFSIVGIAAFLYIVIVFAAIDTYIVKPEAVEIDQLEWNEI